ncbi:hypothetical protein FD755_023342 [Muntiacus reevesi]|uniref:DNA-directed RNA polymerase II subunit GRINL1A n=1 Tax=Muntiacus reevesi TaxID=9886 RepID=A0A5N3VY25_MUNRE|nr:hypothetical protein FD755_023342 [Muntiacus reevesi]
MSSLPHGFQPQTPEDLGQQSLAELQEMLKRQERLLRNISDAVAKLKAAIAEREEVRGRSELFYPRQKAIAVVDGDRDKAQNSDQILDTSSPVPGCSSAAEAEHTVSEHPTSSSRAPVPSSFEASEGLPQHCALDQVEDHPGNSDNLFIDRLQRITIADPTEHHSEGNQSPENLASLWSGPQKKPHYMEVLEMRAKNPMPPPHKFKTNVLASQRHDSSSACQRRGSPVSSEERWRWDRKHRDDITAALLLPTQLLSIEGPLALQRQQEQSHEEMLAKLAAQKQAERPNTKMQSCNPEGESSRKHQEVREEDDDQSSKDEF